MLLSVWYTRAGGSVGRLLSVSKMTNHHCSYPNLCMVLLAAVQNERDTISKRPRGEETENKHGLTTSVLLSAEILSRPATSPPGKLYCTTHLA